MDVGLITLQSSVISADAETKRRISGAIRAQRCVYLPGESSHSSQTDRPVGAYLNKTFCRSHGPSGSRSGPKLPQSLE